MAVGRLRHLHHDIGMIHPLIIISSLRHHADIVALPQALEIMRRSLIWAAEGREIAPRQGLDRRAFNEGMNR